MKGELERTGTDAFRIEPGALDLRVAVAGGLATTAPLAIGVLLGAMFVILNGLRSQSSVPTLTIQSAAGGVAGLAIMILAGLGRGSSRGEPAPTLAGIVRGVGVALRHDATLRTHALRVGLA